MSSLIKGSASKRPLSATEDIEVINSPQNSPRKLGTRDSTLNGMPVEKQDHSLYKSPSEILSQQQPPAAASSVRRNLFHAFEDAEKENLSSSLMTNADSLKKEILDELPVLLETEIQASHVVEEKPIPTKKVRNPFPPMINLGHFIKKRVENGRFSFPLDVEKWSAQASNFSEAFRSWELASVGAHHTPKRQKEILESLANRQLNAGRYRDALVTCKVIDGLFPLALTTQFLIEGLCYLKLKNYKKGCESLEKAEEKYSTSPVEEHPLTDAERTTHSELISRGMEILKIVKDEVSWDKPLLRDILETLSLLQIRCDEIEDAIDTLQEKEDFFPGSGLLSRAALHFRRGEFDESHNLFKLALQKKSENPDEKFRILINAACMTYVTSEKKAEIFQLSKEYSRWALSKADKEEEKDEALEAKFNCEFSLKEYREALATAQTLRTLKLFPQVCAALCHFKLQQAPEGIQLLKDALPFRTTLRELDPEIVNECVLALKSAGEHSLADQYLQS
jgi:tetratricopeptide (TPR) repeat protein